MEGQRGTNFRLPRVRGARSRHTARGGRRRPTHPPVAMGSKDEDAYAALLATPAEDEDCTT